MTTRAKLTTAAMAANALMLPLIFSKPLHIPWPFQWVLILACFAALYLLNVYLRQWKKEKAAQSTGGNNEPASVENNRRKTRNRLLLAIAIIWILGLCSPLWLPLTGVTLGTTRDLVVGIISAVIATGIIGFQMRKI